MGSAAVMDAVVGACGNMHSDMGASNDTVPGQASEAHKPPTDLKHELMPDQDWGT